jgi:Zn finger protein HypA/HybF involved in hydrogenase expression
VSEAPGREDPPGEVATAREKFPCAACGAEARWDPARSALVCPFCGTVSPATLQGGQSPAVIVEHDLAAALRAIPDSARGWQADKIAVRCQSCQAISVFDPGRVAQRCDFCGSSALVPYEQVKDAFRPESLLPLRISESQARDLIHAWVGSQWLAPSAFQSQSRTDTVKGVYLPYWTFDARADAQWRAESGRVYFVREGDRQVQRTEWRPVSGSLTEVFDDELVCASRGVDADRLREVEPFPTAGLVPYDPGYLAGWTVERYQIDLLAAARRSRQQMEVRVHERCAEQVPGDTYRNLEVQATFTGQTFKHILVPVWLMTYVYGARSYQVVVNGVTGVASGARPWSAAKIALLVLAILFVVSILYLAAR